MGEHYPCNTSLSLGRRGFADAAASMNWGRRGCELQERPLRFNVLFPPCSKGDEDGDGSKLSGEELDATSCRLRLWTADPEEDVVGGGGHAESNGGGKKKLRLSKDQLALLELYFRQQNTLNATQKQELAERLNLRPRQVEVWFQNKRARTKLKQTEVDCEFLKKCCESLSDENQRLKEELRELRSSKQGSPFYINLPETAARPSTMRPSCERLAASDGGARCLNDVDEPARGNPRSRVVPSNTGSMSFMGGLRQKFQ